MIKKFLFLSIIITFGGCSVYQSYKAFTSPQAKFERRFMGKITAEKKNISRGTFIKLEPAIFVCPYVLHPEYIKSKIETYSEQRALTEEEKNKVLEKYLKAFEKTSIYVVIYGRTIEWDISEISGMIKPEMWNFYLFDEKGNRYKVKGIDETLNWWMDDGTRSILDPNFTGAEIEMSDSVVLENNIILQFDYDLPLEPTNLKFMATGSVARFEYSFNWEEIQEN